MHPDGQPFPSDAAQAAQRLSSTGHWVVPVSIKDTLFTVLTFQAGPPVFDGPEDRNGLRNRDEIRFWQVFLDEAFDAIYKESTCMCKNWVIFRLWSLILKQIFSCSCLEGRQFPMLR